MTALQEAAKQALEALEHIQRCIGFATATIHRGSATWCQSEDAIASIKAALAQQELPQKERPDFMAGYDAGMADAKCMAQQGEPVAWAIYDKRGGSKSIHWAEQHTDGNAEMYNAIPLYKAASAPQPAQEPVKFLVNGTRFKLSFDTRGRVSSLWNFMDKLDGRWVALVAAENDCHLQSTALSVTAAGEREAGFTTGHCKEHAKPGGCQLHNLQCGYPACDRRAV